MSWIDQFAIPFAVTCASLTCGMTFLSMTLFLWSDFSSSLSMKTRITILLEEYELRLEKIDAILSAMEGETLNRNSSE